MAMREVRQVPLKRRKMRRPPVVSVERREGVRLNGNAQWAGSITWGGMKMAIKGMMGMDGNGWEWMGMMSHADKLTEYT